MQHHHPDSEKRVGMVARGVWFNAEISRLRCASLEMTGVLISV